MISHLAWAWGSTSQEDSSLSVVPVPFSSESDSDHLNSVPRDPASTSNQQNRGATVQPLQPKTIRDEADLQVQQKLYVPDRKSSRDRKVMNLESNSEE